MEYKLEDRQKKQEEEQGEKSLSLSMGVSAVGQKLANWSKREAIRRKKSLKKEWNGHKKAQLVGIEHQSTPKAHEEDSAALMTGFRAKKQKITWSLSQLTTPYSLDKLIHKPPYITVTKGNRIIGDFGHSTALFKRPVIEGDVYMEFLIKEDARRDKKTSYSSSVRIGVCPHSFNPSFPLGYRESLCYKSADGSIISQGQKLETVALYGMGDVVGIVMKISPPKKLANPGQLNEDSSVIFYKNGEKVKECKGLKQLFYCFAVSLYNYSQVQVVGFPQSVYKMPPGSKHYFSILGEKIPYKDLEIKRLFKL